jgi:hypothetical protein
MAIARNVAKFVASSDAFALGENCDFEQYSKAADALAKNSSKASL